jgi:hypothetical protein
MNKPLFPDIGAILFIEKISMKKLFKEHGARILTVLILAASLILALAGQPGHAIAGSGGWLIVRTLLWFDQWLLPLVAIPNGRN